MPTIPGEIKRAFRDRTWSVHVPRDLTESALRVERKVTELAADLRRQPTVGEVARALDLGEENVLEALRASNTDRTASRPAPRSADDGSGDTPGTSDRPFARADDGSTLARPTAAVASASARCCA